MYVWTVLLNKSLRVFFVYLYYFMFIVSEESICVSVCVTVATSIE